MELLTVVVAGALALAGAWLGAWWGGRASKDQWLRDARLRVYGELLEAVTSALQFARDGDRLLALDAARAQARLLASPGVAKVLPDLITALVAAQHTKRGGMWPDGDPAFAHFLDVERRFIKACAADVGAEG